MSYNTRRAAPPTNSAASVGQRRPGPAGNQQQPTGNFVPAGANPNLTKSVAQTPVHQQQQQQHQQGGIQRQPPQQQPLQQQQKPQAPVQRQQPPQQATLQQQRTPQQFVNQQQANILHQPNTPQQPKVVFKTETASPIQVGFKTETASPIQAVDKINTNGNESEEAGDGTGSKKSKPFWMKTGAVRVSRRERLRRRNERLRRMLQPKNALMVLNELVGGTAYNVSESADLYDGSVFKCVVTVDGREHVGIGKSKPAAKGAAAEAALKYLVQTRYKNAELQSTDISADQTVVGEEKMDTTEEPAVGGGISWSHVASYALHKLLSEWDEGASLAEKLCITNPSASPAKAKSHEKKPAKKLPETAATMNPIMLLNQMHPNAVYEDVGKTGNPPHVQFTVKCTINGEVFNGTGTSKKAARKLCAFGACIKVLGMEYAPAFMEEHGVTFDASGNVVYIPPTVTEQPAMQVA